MNEITPVILCGGSGTRLWPLSRRSFPKQFVPLVGDKSLLQLTLARASHINEHMVVAASEAHRFMVTDAMQAEGVSGAVVLEPTPRNTAAAMASAALYGAAEGFDLLLFCPADHYIPDSAAFARMVDAGRMAAGSGAIVTFGVSPSFPSTAYGYIQQGSLRSDGSYEVDRFIEKPDSAKAQRMLLSGGVLWNAGIFLCRTDVFLDALELQAPDILSSCRAAMAGATTEDVVNGSGFIRPQVDAFSACRSESIDYAVMEKSTNVVVVPFDGRWSDVGSWNAVADLVEGDESQNRVLGHGVFHGASNTFVHAPHHPVVALGTRDLLIIDTPDALLVAHRDYAEQVKDVVSSLEKAQFSQVITHRKVARPWGWFDSLDFGDRFQVKRIGVKPGASLSLQKHHHRAEHWVVVNGTAEVTRGEETLLLTENQSIYIPIGEIHRLKNPGIIELIIVEIQTGSYLGEDDIVRFDDSYGRG